MTDYELLPHTADLKMRVSGATMEELFRNALIGMFQLLRPQTDEPGCMLVEEQLVCKQLPISRQVSVEAPDRVTLLVHFLSEVLCLSDVYNEAYLAVDIQILTQTRIDALVHGITITRFASVEIKAVTYHDVSITEHEGRWQATLVFDI